MFVMFSRMSAENEEQKPVIPTKSSMEILSELFSTFHAAPPLIIKEEKSEESSKKHKKSKKKHKHKDKKHKKKERKKRKTSVSSDESEVDLAKILIKQEERDVLEKKIKIEGTNLAWDIKLKNLKKEKNPQEIVDAVSTTNNNQDKIPSNESSGKSKKIVIKDLKLSSIFESSVKTSIDKVKKKRDEDGEINSDSTISDKEKRRKKKHKHKSELKKRSRSRSKDKTEKKLKVDDLRYKIKTEHKHRHKSPNRGQRKETERYSDHNKDINDDFHRSSERNQSKDGHKSYEKERHQETRSKERYKDEYTRELEDYKRNRNRDSLLYKDDGFYKSRDRERESREEKWFIRDR